jgi:outer membrane protein assembly factor BamB
MYCFSGTDGQIIWRLQAADAIGCVSSIPDVDDDNVPDAICGAWGNSLDEKVYCVSGASSGVVYTPVWSYNCGGDIQSVIAIPDQNGDNKHDVIAGTWSDSVFCLSGADGARIWATYVYGLVVKVAEIPDLIGPSIPGIGVAHIGSSFQVLDASTGAVYWSYPIGSNVWTVDAIEDLNNDGKCDVLTGNQNPGVVYCLSGTDGSVIWQYNEGRLIFSVRAVDDISFDGYQDVVAGTQDGGGVAHLLAICGGTPGTGIEDHSRSSIVQLGVYPSVGKNSFNILFSPEVVEAITIYDVAGRVVKRFDEDLGNADHMLWNAQDESGRSVAQGIYFVQVDGDDFSTTEKLVIVR